MPEKKPPMPRSKSKTIFKGRLLHLTTELQTLPNGHKKTIELIRHPGAALIVPFLNKNTIVMIRQYRPAIGTYLYELPAGTLDRNERPLHCAKREIVEEIGYRARYFKKLGMIYPAPGYSDEKITIYKAWNLTPDYRPGDPDEIIQIRKYTFPQMRKLVKLGKIRDSKTLAAFTLVGIV